MWFVFVLVTAISISLLRAYQDEQHSLTIVKRQKKQAIQDESRVITEWDSNIKEKREEREINQENQLNRERAQWEQDKIQREHEKNLEEQDIKYNELKIDKLGREYAELCSSLIKSNEEQVRLTNEQFRVDADVNQELFVRHQDQLKEDNRQHLAMMDKLSKESSESDLAGRSNRRELLQQQFNNLNKRQEQLDYK